MNGNGIIKDNQSKLRYSGYWKHNQLNGHVYI